MGTGQTWQVTDNNEATNANDMTDILQHLKQSPYMDFPYEITMETYTKCNAACSFCPYPSLERIDTKMSDSLIEKIIRDLGDVPKNLPFLISPFKVNEPLLDIRIFDVLATCNEQLPNAGLRIFSNGSTLTAKNLKKLARLKNIIHLWISLNHYQPEEYEALMKMPLKRTLKCLDVTHRMKGAGELPFDIVVSRVCDNTDTDRGFKTWVEQRYPLFKCIMVGQAGWLGDNDNPAVSLEVPEMGCARWYEINITSTGVVALCCMDGHAAYPIGDVSKQHVLEVYNNPAYKKMREGSLNRSAYSPCNQCSL